MKYRVIGFNDVIDKPDYRPHNPPDHQGRGIKFRPEHIFVCETLPSEVELRKYATELGYLPRKARGLSQTQCQPVYYHVSAK